MTTFFQTVDGMDNKALLMFAIPGSGKTRTVFEAAAKAGCDLHREKLVDGHRLIVNLKKLANHTDHKVRLARSRDNGRSLVGACHS